MGQTRIGTNNAIVCQKGSSGSNTIGLHGNTTVNGTFEASGNITLGKEGGGSLNLWQFGGSNYEPQLRFYNYDADNSASAGFSSIGIYNSKSDTEADVATDADAHLGRILWHGNGGDGEGNKFAAHIACRQTSAWSATNDTGYVGSQINLTGVAQKADGSTTTANLSWAGPATPHASSGLNLIVGGASAQLTQPAANQIMIIKGTAPSTAIADYVFIGAKDSAGTGTDTKTTLELKLEEDVDATALDAVGTLTTRIPIWVNGTAYWLYLDPV